LLKKTTSNLKESSYYRVDTDSLQKSTSSWVWWLTPVIPAALEAKIRKIEVQGHPGKIVQETPPTISKLTRVTWTGDVAQVVECLLCKCSNPSPRGKKKKSAYINRWPPMTSRGKSVPGALPVGTETLFFSQFTILPPEPLPHLLHYHLCREPLLFPNTLCSNSGVKAGVCVFVCAQFSNETVRVQGGS
jgi:hypothetical protein